MDSEILDRLYECGCIRNYKYENVSDDGEINKKSKMRNTERLTLYFPDGEVLVINTFCSGTMENTSLDIADHE